MVDTPTKEEIERALTLADDENANSISKGKNFNSDGWAKRTLAQAYRALKAENEKLKDVFIRECASNKTGEKMFYIANLKASLAAKDTQIEKLREAIEKALPTLQWCKDQGPMSCDSSIALCDDALAEIDKDRL